MGADHCVLVGSSDARSVAKQVIDCLGDRPEYSIETCGAEASLAAAIYASSVYDSVPFYTSILITKDTFVSVCYDPIAKYIQCLSPQI